MRPSRRRPRWLLAAGRTAAGFLAALAFWFGFSSTYERVLAATTEPLLRSAESPPVTRLTAGDGEILVQRSDFPPAAPRPGLPAADIHFNFVLLVTLFALDPEPWRPDRVAALLFAALALFLVHTIALAFQVRSLYVTSLGEWSHMHYGAFARRIWPAGFHLYQIAGRFAAPFAIWWAFRREEETETERPRRKEKQR